MYLNTKHQILKTLPNRFRFQYNSNRKLLDGKFTDDIYDLLIDEENLTEEKAIEIIGNKSWTDNICDECKKDVNALIYLGEEPNIESNTAAICKDCLLKSVNLINETKG